MLAIKSSGCVLHWRFDVERKLVQIGINDESVRHEHTQCSVHGDAVVAGRASKFECK